MPVNIPRPEHETAERRALANQRRSIAQAIAADYPNPATQTNLDEVILEDDGFAASFTKGLSHGSNGILNTKAHYNTLVEAINQALSTDFDQVQRGITAQRIPNASLSGEAFETSGAKAQWRGWESPRAGHYYSVQGPDADAVAMPPAPELGSAELVAEMAEVYALAMLRDNSFSEIESSTDATTPSGIAVDDIVSSLTSMDWYGDENIDPQNLQERRRRIARFQSHADHDVDNPPKPTDVTRNTIFRGSSPGVESGPYISQFMLQGNKMVPQDPANPVLITDASLSYGSQEIDQKVSFFPRAVDYMLHWKAYLDVQNGADFGAANRVSPKPRRFINTPRDLATYVRFDQLYQAYLNACLLMLSFSNDFKTQQPIGKLQPGPGFPDGSSDNSRQAFATWAGPHILALVTEVSTRCLKAVRRQKYNYHRRARPERIGALLTLDAGALSESVAQNALSAETRAKLSHMRNQLQNLLPLVTSHNQSRRADVTAKEDRPVRKDGTSSDIRPHADPHLENDVQQLDPENWDDAFNLLLPMAFAEGSPMHPSYGAGHATVAGGCVTMLKAFFHTVNQDGSAVAWPASLPIVRVEENSDAQKLRTLTATDSDAQNVTISGELNKLAANISIGRNMAGVHYYTDYYESLRMGERVTTGILIEHLAQIDEPVELDFHSFDGDHVHLIKDNSESDVQVLITNSQGGAVCLEQWWVRHLPETTQACHPVQADSQGVGESLQPA